MRSTSRSRLGALGVLALITVLVGCRHEARTHPSAGAPTRCQPLAFVAGEHAPEHYDLFRVGSDGHLTQETRDFGTYDPAVAPNGAWLAATRSPAEEWSDANGYENSQIVIMGPTGSVEARIEPRTGWRDHSPSVDPGAQQVAFIRQNKVSPLGEVAVVDRDSTHERTIAKGKGWFTSRPAWSPDGTTIAVLRDDRHGQQLLDLIDLTGGATTSWPVAVDGDPVFSPDGTRVLVSARNYETSQPMVEVDVASGDRAAISHPKRANWTNASYADRDGMALRVLRFDEVVEMVPQRLEVVNRDGTVRSSTTLDVVPIVDVLENPIPLPDTRTLLTSLSTSTCFTPG